VPSRHLEQTVIDSAPTAMVMIDANGRMVLVNTQTELLFGHTRERMLGQLVEMLVPERFRPRHPGLRQGFFVAPETRRMGAGRDLFGLRADGSEVPVEIGLNPIRTDDGLFVLSAIVDITERKRMEDTVRQARDELEVRVRELARSSEALERSNLELQRFAYIASHDLQAPLRSVCGFVQLLNDRLSGRLDHEADDWIRRAIEGTKRMQGLIKDLLSYARVDARARPFEAVALGEVVEDARAALEASLHEAHATITVGPLPVISGDRALLVQLFQNLIGNAITYHGAETPVVSISAEKRDEEWYINVADNGIGIPERHRQEVFEIFRRLHAQEAYPGTGLGLAICRRVVHRHGGRIWIESNQPVGSVFRIAMPASQFKESPS